MSKFIVVKRNTMIFIAIVILLFIFSSFIFINFITKSTVTTLGSEDNQDNMLIDLNGDGKNYELYIDKSKDIYCVKVKFASKEVSLIPNGKQYTLGSQNNNDKIYIKTQDLTRDDIPEVIISTFINKEPVNHIFKYSEGNFLNIISTDQNIVGILNSKNTKSPTLISLSSSKGDESVNSYILKGNNFKDISFSKTKTPGLSTSQQFIDAIEKPYEVLETPDIFSSDISSDELSLLWNLDKETYVYSFENGFFRDIDWDSNGDSRAIEWNLRFNCSKKIGSSEKDSQINIYIKIEKSQYGDFKISSLKKY